MDKFDRSHSQGTYRLMRAEHLAVMAGSIGLALSHWSELDPWRFAATFIVIDALGYAPGLVAYLHAGRGPIAPAYHHAYNLLHSYLTWGVVILAWAWLSGWEWAMLAVPIHLSGDRGLFGNVFKPAGRSFEPAPPPAAKERASWN
jgi:hypothetical protein